MKDAIQKYLEENTQVIVDDIKTLVKIPSVTGTTQVIDAMEAALKIAQRMGFKTQNHKNIIGIADLEGQGDKQLGIIGHMDVVPAGPGWNLEPFDITYTDGYLIGRGVLDDKGPNIMMLHAINFLKSQGFNFNYNIRYLFGTDEEAETHDVEVFKQDFKEPDLVISPDGDFPVCYGEKGLYRFSVSSPLIKDQQLLSLKAGTSPNAVAGNAIAKIKANRVVSKKSSRLAHAIRIEDDDEEIIIRAKGRSAHAAEPYEGIDSIAVISQFLLEQNIGSHEEQEFLRFISNIAGKPDGKTIGIDCEDEDFGELTITCARLRYTDNHLIQEFDCRYPTNTKPDFIKNQIMKYAPIGSTIKETSKVVPYLLDKNSSVVKVLQRAYEEATGTEAKLFTMGGFTYARDFKNAASFGPYMEWVPRPAWVGSLHGPDEGVSVKVLQDSFKIYVYMLKYINELDF